MDESRPLLNVAQAADRLNMSIHQVYRRIHTGDLKATRVRNRNLEWRVSEEDLQRYTEGQRNQMLTVPDAAIMLGFSAETVRRMCIEGKLQHVRGGGDRGHFRIPGDAVREYLDGAR